MAAIVHGHSAASLSRPCAGRAVGSAASAPCVLRGSFFGEEMSKRALSCSVQVVSQQRETGAETAKKSLLIQAAKKVSTARSYVLTSTLVVKEGNEEAVMKLCKDILAWAEEKKVHT